MVLAQVRVQAQLIDAEEIQQIGDRHQKHAEYDEAHVPATVLQPQTGLLRFRFPLREVKGAGPYCHLLLPSNGQGQSSTN